MKNNKSVSFFEGVLVALGFSLTASILNFTLTSLFADPLSAKLLITGLAIFYVGYLLHRSRETTGRITVILLWFIITITVWLLSASLLLTLAVQLVIISLVRSVYFYSSLFSTAADLALTTFSLMAAMWALSHTGSLFLALWCFFLTQALFILIPASIHIPTRNNEKQQQSENSFQQSYRVAEAAVSKLSNRGLNNEN